MAGTSKNTKQTPLMRQYFDIKSKHPGALLLFRVGDFYETFGEDAVKASMVLGIVLTNRNNGGSKLELAGFPHHSLNTYLPKLVRAGYRVAICDQLEAPSKEKKIVKRGVTELVTPGVAFNDAVLDHKSNNFLASIVADRKTIGIAFLDVTTGEFFCTEGSFSEIQKTIQSFAPQEIIFQKIQKNEQVSTLVKQFNHFGLEDWVYTYDYASEKLKDHFEVKNLKGFGIEQLRMATIAAGSILHYITENKHTSLSHISNIQALNEVDYVWMDGFTIRNLELISSPHYGAKTLADIVDRTHSPMGARLLKRWITMPLKNMVQINERLAVVEQLHANQEETSTLIIHLAELGDLERLVSKIAVGKVHPRELLSLKRGLQAIVPIKSFCEESQNTSLKAIGKQLDNCEALVHEIEQTIDGEAPVLISKGGVIKSGVSKELDDLRAISFSGKDYLLKMQERETEATGISSLKIGFNNVFGYYLEVRNVHKDKVPESWIRKQTLTSAERYITEELKEYEEKILTAEATIGSIEASLYTELVERLLPHLAVIQKNAALLARLDCLTGFALVASDYNYVKPLVNDDTGIDIKNGRHPVIEQNLPIGESYVSNDVRLNDQDQQIIIITGPNMVGKSALLRQTALIVIMAQMGCYVPVDHAQIGIIDKVFTRVGASDNISSGESTFMVEMSETASILNNISDRSLVLLDEIGRGTSTYDGISIAWAITEYLHENGLKPKTLFATHYHELNDMADSFSRIKNYNVSVKESNGQIIFLRKLVAGGSEHSFGIHVAKIAGVPKAVVKKAQGMLEVLESKAARKSSVNVGGQLVPGSKASTVQQEEEEVQLSFFQLDDPVLEQIRDEIKNMNINELTPVDALNKLNEIKKLTGV